MKILIDIGHPAHVHYFKNLIFFLRKKHDVWVTCRDTGIVQYLLRYYDIPFDVIGDKRDGLIAKIGKQFVYAKKIRDKISRYKIDISMGVSGSAVHGALFTNAKSILFDDDDQAVQPLMAKFVSPFADTILSPGVLNHENLRKAIYYPGYHELAYLHPNVYQPNPHTISKYGLKVNDKYYVLRFNAFKAHHDVKEGGMNLEQKRLLVHLLKPHGRVFITTEDKLNDEFNEYKLPIAPEDIHDFLAYSQMLISDSQTMSSEAAILGSPSFRCNSFAGRLSVLEEEEKKFGLTMSFLPRQFEWMVYSIKQHLQTPDLKAEWQAKRIRMLQEKIDVSAFWLWFIEHYPESENLVKQTGFVFENLNKCINCSLSDIYEH